MFEIDQLHSENSNVKSFPVISLLLAEKIKVEVSIFKFLAVISACDVASSTMYFSYFYDIGLIKFSETSYAKFMAPPNYNLV